MKLHAKLVDGQDLEFEIYKYPFMIGRSSQCDIVIHHEGMSRRHCQVELRGNDIYITDLNSVNGVLIDGQKIPPGVPTFYTTFLSLGFGAVQSLYIELDDGMAHEMPIKAPSMSAIGTKNAAPATLKLETGTVTKAMKPKAAAEAAMRKGMKGSDPSQSKDKNIFIKMISFIIILAVIIYMAFVSKPQKTKVEELTPTRNRVNSKEADFF